ncbi:MAG: BTAD domain-containing putative transcriptional regulator, partial [Gemmatimonadota bacterium]
MQLKLFGSASIETAYGPVTGRGVQRRRLAFLALLAGNRTRGVSRDRVASLLWPEADQEKARHLVSDSIYRINQTLGVAAVVATGDDLRLDPAALPTDVGEFESAIARADWLGAIALYAGPFLDGFHLAESAEFDEWVEGERSELEAGFRRAVEQAATAAGERHDHAEAVRWWRLLATKDRLSARVAIGYMLALDASGDRTAAIQHARIHTTLVEAELGAVSDRSVDTLAERLRHEPVTRRPRTPALRDGGSQPVAPSVTPTAEASEPPAEPARNREGRRWLVLSGTVAGVALLALVASRLIRREPPAIEIGRRTQVTLGPGLEVHPALSPNGDIIAYSTGPDSRLFVRQVEGGSVIPVARDLPGVQGWPHWSPDGKQLTFSSPRGIEIVPALGGAPRLLVPAPPSAGLKGSIVVGGPWSPDGREVAFERGDTLYAEPLAGGAPRIVTIERRLHSCVWSPDGGRIACVSGNFEAMMLGPIFGNLGQSAILIIPSTGGRPTRLIDDGYANASPAWMPDGMLLFVSNREGGRDVYAVRLDREDRATGTPHRITTGLNALTITIPANGSRIGYAAFAETSNIWWMPAPTGVPGSIADAKQVTTGDQVIEWFDISRDGQRLVFDSDRSGNSDLYRMALDRADEPEQLTRDSLGEFYPAWSPDGREIAFHRFFAGRRQAYIIPGAGGAGRLVARTDDDDR